MQFIYKELKRISGIRENLVLFLAVFFLIISVLIGVIIWLSVSVHLINISNIQTTSILDELLSSNRANEKSSQFESSTEFFMTVSVNPNQVLTSPSQTAPMLKAILKIT